MGWGWDQNANHIGSIELDFTKKAYGTCKNGQKNMMCVWGQCIGCGYHLGSYGRYTYTYTYTYIYISIYIDGRFGLSLA